MNLILREHIIKHILASLRIIPSKFIDQNITKAIMSKEYILDKTFDFIVDDEVIHNKIWGCQLSAEDRELKIILADCSQETDIFEYCLLVQLKNAPAYASYFVFGDQVDSEALLACNVNESGWLECNTYLQATFLAGMEQLKDINLTWSKCLNYDKQIDLIKSFIEYHDLLFGNQE